MAEIQRTLTWCAVSECEAGAVWSESARAYLCDEHQIAYVRQMLNLVVRQPVPTNQMALPLEVPA